jgi:hypothetical protein
MASTSLEKVCLGLAEGKIQVLNTAVWEEISGQFLLKKTVPTGLAGDILLVRWPKPEAPGRQGWGIVEEPAEGERVIRPLATQKEALALIAERMAAYERMWDG